MVLDVPLGPRSSLADQVVGRLIDSILRGDVAPGERIKEALVARELGISRGPLREALSRLESQGLVERKPHFGVRIIALTQEDLEELFVVREALEGTACALAAERMSDKEIDQLSEMVTAHSQSIAAGGYYQGVANDDFHFRIVRGSRNRRLVRTLCDELYLQLKLYRFRSSTSEGRPFVALDEHRQIVDALRSRDPHRAEAAMRRHIANARENLLAVAREEAQHAQPTAASRGKRRVTART